MRSIYARIAGLMRSRDQRGGSRRARPGLEAIESRLCLSAAAWQMYNSDPTGSRLNPTETTLNIKNVNQLGVQWQYATEAPVAGTPAVVHRSVYAGDMKGNFYALDRAGNLQWKVNVGHAITDSAIMTQNTVIFGDLDGNIYGLNAKTGTTKWTIHPNNSSQKVSIWSSGTLVGKNVAFGVASLEEDTSDPNYKFTNRGSALLLNPANGKVLWQTYTITPEQNAAGWSGASIWASPTYDASTNTMYVATGNSFSQPVAGATGPGLADPGTSDAVIALNATTGAIKWKNELTKGDIWNGSIVPSPTNPDADLGDSPQVYKLANGTKVIGVGQKSGVFYVLNAKTGAAINSVQLEVGGVEGGLFSDTGVDQKAGRSVANGINWPGILEGKPPVGGNLYVTSLDGKQLFYDFKTAAPNSSGVAIANGVIYFSSDDGTLYALNERAKSADTALLAKIKTGSNYSGPAVSRGHVYVGGGDAQLFLEGETGTTGSITGLGLGSTARAKAARRVR